MPIIARYTPCENLVRFNQKAMDKSNPERAYAFSLLFARQQLYLGRYDDYKETKAKLYEENTIKILAGVIKITDQILEYHAKRGEIEKIMSLVGAGIVLKTQALRILLENRRYTDYKYLAKKFNITRDDREDLVYSLLIDLYGEGKYDIADEVKSKKLVSELTIYELIYRAKVRVNDQKKEDGKIWAALMLMNASDSANESEYWGNSYVKSVLGPIDWAINNAKKMGSPK